MVKHAPLLPFPVTQRLQPTPLSRIPRPLLLGGIGLVLCALFSAVPLARAAGIPLLLALPTNVILLAPGSWLPANLGLSTDITASQGLTSIVVFLTLIALMFILYGLTLWFLRDQVAFSGANMIFWWIIAITFIIGGIYVLTPAMISHDIFVYAGYGRLLAVHAANPYFVPFSTYPHDPFVSLDDWRAATSAYGPVWLAVCSLGAMLGGPYPLAYVIIYRVIGLGAHLLNIVLITSILRLSGRSSRTVILAALFYAWNPLVLLEGCLGAHNDIFLITLLLLGWLFLIKAEQKSAILPTKVFHASAARSGMKTALGCVGTYLRQYLPSLLFLTLAVLIKFTVAPVVVLVIVLLARRMFSYGTAPSQENDKGVRALRWQNALLLSCIAGASCACIALLGYLPFWLGHSAHDIVRSFTTPPSSTSAYGSVLRALLEWKQAYGLPEQGLARSIFSFFSAHTTWSAISVVTLVATLTTCGYWLWHEPHVRILALASLAVMGGLFIVTPWFFPWYVTALVGFAAIGLPVRFDRLGRALVAFAFAFSASAFFIYLFYQGLPPVGGWIGSTCLTTIAPPLLAFTLALLWTQRDTQRMEKPS